MTLEGCVPGSTDNLGRRAIFLMFAIIIVSVTAGVLLFKQVARTDTYRSTAAFTLSGREQFTVASETGALPAAKFESKAPFALHRDGVADIQKKPGTFAISALALGVWHVESVSTVRVTIDFPDGAGTVAVKKTASTFLAACIAVIGAFLFAAFLTFGGGIILFPDVANKPQRIE